MENSFIQMVSPDLWGPVVYRLDLVNYTKEELKADNFYRVVRMQFPVVDTDKTVVTSYELIDDVVYEKHVVENKTGEDLKQAIFVKWQHIRQIRNILLSESDWTQLPDAPLTDEKRTAWATFRQELRDITNQNTPYAIAWPTNPNGRTYSLGVTRV